MSAYDIPSQGNPGVGDPTSVTPNMSYVTGFLDSKFQLVSNIATSTVSGLDSWLNSIMNEAKSLVASMPTAEVTYDFQEISLDSNIEGKRPEAPADTEISIAPGTWYDYVNVINSGLEDVTLESLPQIPSLTAQEPSISVPNIPDMEIPSAPEGRPSMGTVETPQVPSFTLPDPPSIEEVSIPSPPDITIPQFSAELPSDELLMPENTFAYSEPGYDSTMADAITQALLEELRNGGTGLSADVEQAIFDRAIARRELEDERLYNEAEKYFSSRGWKLPPGALAGRLAEVAQEVTRRNDDINEKVMIEQARLADQNARFIKETIINWQQVVNAQFNAVADRALRAAAEGVNAAAKIVEAQVAVYNAKVEKYRAQAAVYNSRIQAELLILESYRQQLEGRRLTAEIQQIYVNLYQSRIDGLKMLASLYNTQMEGARLQLEMERTKIEGYRSEVEAYSAEVAARASVYAAYSAQLQAESAKADVYARQVQAYVGKVEAARIETDAKIARMRARIERNNAKLSAYKTAIDAYNLNIMKETARVNALLEAYGHKVEAYRADAQVEDSRLRAQIETARRNIEQNRIQAELLLKEADMTIQAYTATKNLISEYLRVVGSVKAQVAASALAAFNTSAVLGYQASEGLQGTISHNLSYSVSNSSTWHESVSYHYYPE